MTESAALDLGLASDPDASTTREVSGSGGRLVDVAVDAPGAPGAAPYTYLVPARLGPLEPGEAVIVPYGRRQAIGIVLGWSARSLGEREPRAIVDRVRTDGPILPPLTLALALAVSDHYLAPPVVTIRAFLPPGLLERLELMAERRPDAATDGPPLDPEEVALLDQLESGPRRVRDLSSPEGRPSALRRLRGLVDRGAIALDWTLLAAAVGPRYERWVRIADAAGDGGDRRRLARLGPRQAAALEELGVGKPAVRAADLAARHGGATIASLARRGLVTIEVRERPRRPLAGRAAGRRGARPRGSDLTAEQAVAVGLATEAIAAHDPTPLLLDGITGAGKTAVYVEAIAAALAAGRPVLVLVPEIALATPVVDRLRADLDAEVAVVHSGLGPGERADEWRRIREGEVHVVVGTRAAVGVPLADVGLIVVDEEHEATYKSDRTPRLQARDVAIRLAALAGAALILGSATPAVDTIGLVRRGTYRRVALPTRPAGALPPTVELVDLRAELAAGNRGLVSDRLADALGSLDTDAGDRAILVINRRGSASVVLCRDCGSVQACPECGRPLVFHQAGYTLRCHHCGTAAPLATRCPQCGSPRIRYLGGGTERLEREVRERFPSLRIGRLDRDVVERRGAADRVIDTFTSGGMDVLVGTSLVAKALDVPEVTLVGVVSADVALNLPDERAAERTYQLLVQAIGRAGRGARPGLGLIQSYQPDHPAIRAVVEGDREAFYDSELAWREAFGSPPFGRLVKLTVALAERDEAERTARELAESLRQAADAAAATREPGGDTTVVGPAPAFIARRAGRWRFHLVLRGQDPVALVRSHPGLGSAWSVDVDPETLL